MKPPRSSPKEELEWLFGQAEADLGIRSTFSSMILAMKLARPPGPPPAKLPKGAKRKTRKDGSQLVSVEQEALANEDSMIDSLDARQGLSRIAAVSKLRRVMGAYRLLPARSKVILEAAYEPRQAPPEVRQAFGELAGVARLTPTAQALARFTPAWLAGALTRKDPLAHRMRVEAEALLAGAVEAYAAARRGL